MSSIKLTASLLAAATLAGLAGTAAADSKCSDVGIEVRNQFTSPTTNTQTRIKVVDFEYWCKYSGVKVNLPTKARASA